MTGDRIETFSQDRLGNVNRDLDVIRGLSGMDNSLDENDNPQGLVEIEAGDVGEDLVLLPIPEDARGFYINETHAHNSTGDEEAFWLGEAELDDNGDIDGPVTMRTVPYNVDAETSRTIPHSGKELSGDAVVVNADFEGYVAVGGYMDRREYDEPASEQTSAPGN